MQSRVEKQTVPRNAIDIHMAGPVRTSIRLKVLWMAEVSPHQNLLALGFPDIVLRLFVASSKVVDDRVGQFLDGGEATVRDPVSQVTKEALDQKTLSFELYPPATQERVAVEAGAGEVVEDRARLLEFQIGP